MLLLKSTTHSRLERIYRLSAFEEELLMNSARAAKCLMDTDNIMNVNHNVLHTSRGGA